MPNHITTQLRISGTKEQIDKLVKDTGLKRQGDVDQNQFDFNGIIKMPESLNITSGSNTSLGLIAWGGKDTGVFSSFESYRSMPWWDERYPGIDTPEKLKEYLKEHDKEAYDLGKQAKENLEKYGHSTWYDWCVENWGTKWNSYDVFYTAGGDDYIVIQFDTAWSWPTPIFEKLEEMGVKVDGVSYGEMEGYQYHGDGGDYFDARIEVDYIG